MPYTQTQLDALTEAIASGTRSVTYQDRRVEYQSIEEMKVLKSEMEKSLGVQTVQARSSRASYHRA